MTKQDKSKEQNMDKLTQLRQQVTELKSLRAEHLKTEKELRQSLEQFQTLVETAPMVICKSDLNARATYVNKKFEEITQYSREEILGKNWTKFGLFPEGILKQLLKRVTDKLMGKQASPLEVKFKRRDGEWRWVSGIGELIKEQGKTVGFQVVAYDITERKKTEEALLMYKRIISTTKDLMSFIDRDYIYQAVNEANCKAHGKSSEDIIGYSVSELWGKEVFEKEIRNRLDRCLNGEELHYTKWINYPVLGKRYMDVTYYPSLDSNAVVSGAVICSRDITEHRHAEAETKTSYDKLQKALDGTVKAMNMISEMRDPYTAGHQRRVARLACAIAQEIGFSEDRITGLRLAALIHDIGKIRVPAEILTHPDGLSDSELNIVKLHPQIGHDVLNNIEFPWPIAQIVLQHHERIDGSGYPEGRSGEEIIPEAKILGVADVVEAMASHRPYRPALGLAKSLDEISKNKGKLYDPQIVDACLLLFNKKGFTLE